VAPLVRPQRRPVSMVSKQRRPYGPCLLGTNAALASDTSSWQADLGCFPTCTSMPSKLSDERNFESKQATASQRARTELYCSGKAHRAQARIAAQKMTARRQLDDNGRQILPYPCSTTWRAHPKLVAMPLQQEERTGKSRSDRARSRLLEGVTVVDVAISARQRCGTRRPSASSGKPGRHFAWAKRGGSLIMVDMR